MSLVEHANTELKLAGLLDKDSDYNGMIGESVLELMKKFAAQGHSGFSAHLTLDIFTKLANFKNLTPIGTTKDEWFAHGMMDNRELWQNKRNCELFSYDGGKTYYNVNNKDEIFTNEV